jgi:HlyD family secretion protein
MAKKRLTPYLIGTVILAAGAGAYWFTQMRGNNRAPEISTIPVAKGDVVMAVTASGTLQPVTTVEVSSQVSGLISAVLVDYNSVVKNGDVLARLDPATYEQRLKQAQADLSSAQANYTLTKLTTARTDELYNKGLAAAQDRDQANANLQQADATLKTKEAAVDNAKVDLSRCTIYAPIDGMVLQRAVDVGKTVAASLNAPTLFIIANELAKMQIIAAVAEADVGNVAQRQPVNFTVDAYPGRQFKGEITQIRNYPVTQSNVVTYETVIGVNNDDLKLKPGMTANVSIIVSQRNGVLKVANSALRARVPEELIARRIELPSNATAATEAAPKKQLSDEERRKVMREIFTKVGWSPRDGTPPSPEQIQKIQEEAKAAGIEFDPSRFGRGGNQSKSQVSNTPIVRTIYRLAKESTLEKPVIEAVAVKLGITDGSATEVLEGLNEGDNLVTGVTVSTKGSSQSAANPMMPSFGGPRR